MALNLGTSSTALHPRPLISSKTSRHKIWLKLYDTPSPSCLKSAAALSEGTENRVAEDDPPTYSGNFAVIFLISSSMKFVGELRLQSKFGPFYLT